MILPFRVFLRDMLGAHYNLLMFEAKTVKALAYNSFETGSNFSCFGDLTISNWMYSLLVPYVFRMSCPVKHLCWVKPSKITFLF